MKKNWLVSGILALAAALAYFIPMASCAFPHVLAPVVGTVAVVAVFHLVRIFVSASGGDGRLAGLAGLVSAVVFMLSPAVRSAATHFEPRLLDFAWALMIALLAVPFLSRRAPLALHPVLTGVAWALGLSDSALFLAFLPFYLILVFRVAATRARTRAFVLFFLSAAVAFFAAVWLVRLDLGLFLRRTLVELTSYYGTPGWFFVFFFTTLPFLTILFSEDGALTERPGCVQLLFHGALTFVTILAMVPPLSPSALMAPYGRLPVATSAFAASVAGYLVAYWWINRRTKTARAVGGILCLVLAGTAVWNLATFDARAGVARRVVIRMDENRAREILKKDPDSSLANYVLGSFALKKGAEAEAEPLLRKAAESPHPIPFALNDYAEVLRRGGNCAEAERYARRCVACAPTLYVGWETLGSILLDAGGDLDEAEAAIRKACELSKSRDGKPADVRMLVALVRVQLRRGDVSRAQETIREVRSHLNELTDSERAEFDKLLK